MIAKRERVECKDKIYFQTFEGHITDSIILLKLYLQLKKSVVQAFCNKWSFEQELFLKDLFLTVALHDIGKLTVEFQNNIKAGKSSKDYPHPLFAMPILEHIPFDKYDNLPLPQLAILGHHTQLHTNIYDSLNPSRKVTYFENEILNFVNQQVEIIYEKLGFEQYFKLPNIELTSFETKKARSIREEWIEDILRGEIGDYRIKSIFTYLFSILQLCDDYSSANFSRFIQEKLPDKEIWNSVLDNPQEYVFDFSLEPETYKKLLFNNNALYKFQEELSANGKNYSFLFAPCGRGKTEAALWWAHHIKQKENCDRIIFALPTQTTCNAMYDRFLDEYNINEKYIGLFHGKSFIKLEERIKEEDEQKQYDLLKDERFKGNVFLKSFTVTTIDHLAYALVHGFSQADFAAGNLQNSIIIFDEVHYYEQHTLNVLFAVFKQLRAMKIPHLLMTGTAPDFILKELKSDYKLTRDEEGLTFQPFIINKQNERQLLNEDTLFEEINADYLNEKKIFVIFNQVEWTQLFYSELKNYFKKHDLSPEMILYHSRFIYRDRVKKEQEIKKLNKSGKPFILIATQVIEISLDISSDVMYSQIAPADAIGQRAGRLNRSGQFYKNSYGYELKLFNIDKFNPYDKELIERSWENLKNGPVSYTDIKNVCDIIYADRNIIPYSRYLDYFKNNILFGDRPRDIAYSDEEGKSLKIRESNFQTIDIVPAIFKSELKSYKRKLPYYKCRIPYYYLRNKPTWFERDDLSFQETVFFCHFDYTFVKGLEKNRDEDIENRII